MYKSLAFFINNNKVYTLKRNLYCVIAFLIFAACFTIGCENFSSTELLDVFTEPILERNRTITVTLAEKNDSGITGTATFTEYIDADTEDIGSTVIRNFDVEIQNAGADRKYAAYIYSGSSCDAPGSVWEVEGFDSIPFTTDVNGMGSRSYLIDLTFDTNSDTDINGKVLVIHEQVGSGDLANGTQVSCGIITASE